MEIQKGKNFFFILLGLTAVLATAIFWPFLIVLSISIALAVVLFPLNKWLRKNLTAGSSWASSLITVILFIIILGIPLYFIGVKVATEATGLFHNLADGGSAQQSIDNFTNWIKTIVPGTSDLQISEKLGDLTTFITNSIGKIFTATLNSFLSFLLILVSLFYFLKDGERFRDYLFKLSPLADKYDERIFSKLSIAVNGVMRGYLFIALVQGTLLGLGLALFGVPNPVLWGVLAGITSVIPSIGTAIVSVPSIIFLFLTGFPISALALLVWAVAIVGSIDNVLQPIIVGKNIDLPPIAVLFSVLGGVTMFGVAGLIIGPLSISLFLTLMSIYKEEY